MLLLAAFALFAGSAVQAATINVDVGANGLTYTPSNVTAQDKDTILFTFKGGSHTVTQSSFADPCNPLAGGVDSGPQATTGVATPPTYNYTVNGTAPAWFYCKTGSHCKSGMVFAVNPTAERTFEAFLQKAKGETSSAAPSGSGSGSPSASASGTAPPAATSGTANGRASVGIGAVAAALLFGGMTTL